MKKIGLLLLVLLLVGGCATTYTPGDPAYSWVNGAWEGQGKYWKHRFELQVVADGKKNNKVVGSQERSNLLSQSVGAARRTPPQVEGEVNGDTIVVIPYRGSSTKFVLTKSGDSLILSEGSPDRITLKKVE